MKMLEAVSMQLLGEARVVAGHSGLQRRVSWVHTVDLPEPGPWINRNQLLLTTGYAWSNHEASLRNLIRELDSRGIAGIGLAVPSYWEEFPEAARTEADRLGLPLLEIPWDIPFASISEGINRAIISKQQQHREQADAIHRSLTRSSIEADSLDEILTEFSRLLGRTVILEDVEGSVLGFVGAPETQFPDVLKRQGGAGESTWSLIDLVDPGYRASVRTSPNVVRVPWTASGRSGSLIACPVWLKRERVGILWVPDDTSPLEDIDIQAAEHAATVIALHIARERAVVDVEQRLRYTLIDSLLEGQFTGDALSLERATIMGFDPMAEYRVAIFVLSEPVPLSRSGYANRERLVSRLTRRMIQLGHPPLISPSLNEISVIIPFGQSLQEVCERLLDDDVSAAVGRSYTGIEGVKRSYGEARSVIGWTEPNHITSYEDVLIPRLLQGDREARDHFMASITGPLEDALHADLYRHSLDELAACGFNQKQASERLGIHPKTMQYRVVRIQELLRLNLSDAEARFRIQLFYRLQDIERRKSSSSETIMAN